MDVKEESILGADLQSHWYYVSKGRALRAVLGNKKYREVLDVGAGSGIFSRQLLEAGICDRATCVDPAYSKEYIESFNGKDISFVRSVDRQTQNLVLLMDVLEHVEDDVQLLRQYTESLPHDGLAAITVPAFQFLWSGHDVFLEHYRRYTRATLNEVVAKAGLEVVRSRYFFGLLFPAVVALRLANAWKLRNRKVEAKSSLKKHGSTVNSMLTHIHSLERKLVFPINTVAGLTLFCLARPKQ
jgi:2-polyprenyl-3-methyl-5-hydroxy-6-metoxy-1,4-benzoquinol methylase